MTAGNFCHQGIHGLNETAEGRGHKREMREVPNDGSPKCLRPYVYAA
jgi:hypothetical protein